jgi:hypothetical protein
MGPYVYQGQPDIDQVCFLGRPKGFDLGSFQDTESPRYVEVSAPLGTDPKKLAGKAWRSARRQDRLTRTGRQRPGFNIGFDVSKVGCFFGE